MGGPFAFAHHVEAGLGIGIGADQLHGDYRGQGRESCGVNVEAQWLVTVGASDFEQGAVGDDLADTRGLLPALVVVHDGRAAKRSLDVQTIDAD